MFGFPRRGPVRPADTGPAELAQMRDSALLDLTDRRNQAIALIEAALADVLSRPQDVLLDVRNALIAPEPVGRQRLPLRPSVPVIPGRTS